ncbi:MAG: hypothetical protein AB2598_19420 [Candidatus Thiodiazotropha sp.]
MGKSKREDTDKKALVRIQQKNRFDIIDQPTEGKYYLSTKLKTESTVELLSDAIKDLIEGACEYLHIESISVIPGFVLTEKSFVPIIELECEKFLQDMT